MSDERIRLPGGKPSPLDAVTPAARTMIGRSGGVRPEPPPDPARHAGRQDGREPPKATADGRTRDTADDGEIYDDPPWPEDADTTRNAESYPARGAHNAPPVTAGEASRGGTSGVTHHPFRVRR